MRAQSDPWLSDYLLRIGNGTKDMFVGDYALPKDIVIEYKDEHSIDRLIVCVLCSLISTKMPVPPNTSVSVEFFA
jgi:ATP-dependent DNA helicase PIF1